MAIGTEEKEKQMLMVSSAFLQARGLDLRIVIEPHPARATLLSSFLHETKVMGSRCSG